MSSTSRMSVLSSLPYLSAMVFTILYMSSAVRTSVQVTQHFMTYNRTNSNNAFPLYSPERLERLQRIREIVAGSPMRFGEESLAARLEFKPNQDEAFADDAQLGLVENLKEIIELTNGLGGSVTISGTFGYQGATDEKHTQYLKMVQEGNNKRIWAERAEKRAEYVRSLLNKEQTLVPSEGTGVAANSKNVNLQFVTPPGQQSIPSMIRELETQEGALREVVGRAGATLEVNDQGTMLVLKAFKYGLPLPVITLERDGTVKHLNHALRLKSQQDLVLEITTQARTETPTPARRSTVMLPPISRAKASSLVNMTIEEDSHSAPSKWLESVLDEDQLEELTGLSSPREAYAYFEQAMDDVVQLVELGFVDPLLPALSNSSQASALQVAGFVANIPDSRLRDMVKTVTGIQTLRERVALALLVEKAQDGSPKHKALARLSKRLNIQKTGSLQLAEAVLGNSATRQAEATGKLPRSGVVVQVILSSYCRSLLSLGK